MIYWDADSINAFNEESLADTAADLHIEESGWLPGERDRNDRLMSRESADKTILFLLGVLAGGTAFSVALCATAAAAIAATSVLVAVWVVCFLVWLLWA
jgi:hypothetical protein